MSRRLAYILIVGIITFASIGCVQGQLNVQNRVCFGQQCFDVSVAQTDQERMRGLQFVDDLCDTCGMLFIFSRDNEYGFWMKDTLIPLDIIWLDSEQRIVHIKNNAQPCEKEPCAAFYPKEAARYVVELNAGQTSLWGISVGDKVDIYLEKKTEE